MQNTINVAITAIDDQSPKHPSHVILPDYMPRHEFSMLVIAPKGQGKTTLLLNLIGKIYKGYFHKIYIFSPSIHSDSKWQWLKHQKQVLCRPSKIHDQLHTKQFGSSSKNDETKAGNQSGEGNQDGQDMDHDIEELKATAIRMKEEAGNIQTMIISQHRINAIQNPKRRQEYEQAKQEIEAYRERQRNIQRYASVICAPPPSVIAQTMQHCYDQVDLSKSSQQTHAQEEKDDNDNEDNKTDELDKLPPSHQFKTTKGIIPDDCFFDDYDKETLHKVMKEQEERTNFLEKMKRTRVDNYRLAFLFDDLVGSELFTQSKSRNKNPFLQLNVRHRHFSASLFLVAQAYKEITRTCRVGASFLVLFKIPNDIELKLIYEENSAGLSYDQWLACYRYATNQPHHFLFINNQMADNSPYRMMKNFEEPIYPVNEVYQQQGLLPKQGMY